jgi:acyl carrier protein
MNPTIESVEERLRQILHAVLNDEVDVSRLSADVPLVSKGLALDSVALLHFVVSIENEFAIMLDEGVLTREHFESLGSLARAVQKEIARQTKA